MKILIVDDDVEFSNSLKKDLSNYLDNIDNRKEYVIVNNDFEHIKFNYTFDLAFIDIDLQESNGIEIAKKIKSAGLCNCIVFITSFAHLVFDSLIVHPFYFIRKNEYLHDLQIFSEMFSDTFRIGSFITIKWLGLQSVINVKDIVYIESVNHSLIIHTVQKDYYDSRLIKEILEELNSIRFVRIHKGFIINLDYLVNYGSNHVEMVGDQCITFGRAYKGNFLEMYEEYLENVLL